MLETRQPHTIGCDHGRRKEVWKENPRIRVVTDVRRRNDPVQSREARPDKREEWVGAIGAGGRNVVTTVAQKTITGS